MRRRGFPSLHRHQQHRHHHLMRPRPNTGNCRRHCRDDGRKVTRRHAEMMRMLHKAFIARYGAVTSFLLLDNFPHSIILPSRCRSTLQVMLPNPDHFPPVCFQSPGDRAIPSSIASYLPFPILAIARRKTAMLGAGMPEATIYKYCQTLFWENKVWVAVQRIMPTPSGELFRT